MSFLRRQAAVDTTEHSLMLGHYKPGYFEQTCLWFEGRFVEPEHVVQLENGNDVCAFARADSTWITTTVGFGYPPPDSAGARIEWVALSTTAPERIMRELAVMATVFWTASPPLEPFHEVRFEGETNGYFMLDGGRFEFGWNSQRLIVVPVSKQEYDRLEPRGELEPGVVPSAVEILQLEWQDLPLETLPPRLLARWG